MARSFWTSGRAPTARTPGHRRVGIWNSARPSMGAPAAKCWRRPVSSSARSGPVRTPTATSPPRGSTMSRSLSSRSPRSARPSFGSRPSAAAGRGGNRGSALIGARGRKPPKTRGPPLSRRRAPAWGSRRPRFPDRPSTQYSVPRDPRPAPSFPFAAFDARGHEAPGPPPRCDRRPRGGHFGRATDRGLRRGAKEEEIGAHRLAHRTKE